MGEYNIGDIVTLLSGGPLMTVCEVSKKQICSCKWFVENKVVMEETFPSSCLRKGNIRGVMNTNININEK